MKIKELIEKLQLISQNNDVVLSSDEEGNSYHPLIDLDLKTLKDEQGNLIGALVMFPNTFKQYEEN